MILRNLAIELGRSHPQSVVAALHPGTVATDLSAPFTGSGEGRHLFTPQESAAHLLAVIDRLTRPKADRPLPGMGSRSRSECLP